MTVEYREIPGRTGYRAGSDGSVWSRWTQYGKHAKLGDEWRQLRPRPDTSGYLVVWLSRSQKGYRARRVHHLVLEAFVGTRPAEMECRHLNGNKINNRRDNLRWGTHRENIEDKKRYGIPSSTVVPARPCANCGFFYKRLRKGRCNACDLYFKKHGKERSAELIARWHARHKAI